MLDRFVVALSVVGTSGCAVAVSADQADGSLVVDTIDLETTTSSEDGSATRDLPLLPDVRVADLRAATDAPSSKQDESVKAFFDRLGITLGPRGSSDCDVSPPSIPPFDSVAASGELKVCATGCPYQKIGDALAKAKAGDVVSVAPGEYRECLNVSVRDIVIRGRGGRPWIHPPGCPMMGYYSGVVFIQADNVKLADLEISTDQSDQSDGVVTIAPSSQLSLSNVYIHDVGTGIFVWQGSRTTVTSSYFGRIGAVAADGAHKGAAIGVTGGEISVTGSIFVSPTHESDFLRLDTERAAISCSLFAGLEGAVREGVQFRSGKDALLSKCTLQAGTCPSSGRLVLYWHMTKDALPADRISMTGNVFLNDGPDLCKFAFELGTTVPTAFTDNVTIGPGYFGPYGPDLALPVSQVDPANRSFASRDAAGVPRPAYLPYPGTAASVTGK